MANKVSFYDVKTRNSVEIDAKNCKLEKIDTAKGTRWRVTTTLSDGQGGERKLSRFVKADFKL